MPTANKIKILNSYITSNGNYIIMSMVRLLNESSSTAVILKRDKCDGFKEIYRDTMELGLTSMFGTDLWISEDGSRAYIGTRGSCEYGKVSMVIKHPDHGYTTDPAYDITETDPAAEFASSIGCNGDGTLLAVTRDIAEIGWVNIYKLGEDDLWTISQTLSKGEETIMETVALSKDGRYLFRYSTLNIGGHILDVLHADIDGKFTIVDSVSIPAGVCRSIRVNQDNSRIMLECIGAVGVNNDTPSFLHRSIHEYSFIDNKLAGIPPISRMGSIQTSASGYVDNKPVIIEHAKVINDKVVITLLDLTVEEEAI